MKDMFDAFSHFLAFGISDQRTLRELTHEYDGMIVPGTIAAYQADPTRGFVLSLSASEKLPYAIDSRFPLFQSHLPSPKPSHLLLADILGLEADGSGRWLTEATLSDESLAAIAARWIDFNTKFLGDQPSQFEKYAKRLKRPLPHTEAHGPRWIFPPYFMKDEQFPHALDLSQRLWEHSVQAASARNVTPRLRRVVAVKDPADLVPGAIQSGQDEVVIWVSDLDEMKPENYQRLAAYASAIKTLRANDVTPFALYGGYFAVMLRSLGLAGASHGVGFSESRDHVELKTSGAAPARFYVSRLHRFISRDLAAELWRRRPSLIDCDYPGYVSRDPLDFDYHGLMQHSVHARQHEIHQSALRTTSDYVAELRQGRSSFLAELEALPLPPTVMKRASDLTLPLSVWANALEQAI
ncbi:hypothetical protein [uncultured Microbacterium sp.]|uniref:hypothetical protein n=1 Tax=uncultured Microbacterium sp. TaxID=191216 RepID=UPI0028DC45EF|nr:hypothetical protein [uncultured Microbacterium sp.]